MSFAIVTDTSANLPYALLRRHGVEEVPFSYLIEGTAFRCLDIEAFDGARYYDAIRKGVAVTTSQINPQRYTECFAPLLADGQDILYVGMSSGISGSYSSAELAVRELRERFPQSAVRLVDTYSASLGEGLLVLKAIAYRDEGLSLDATADKLLSLRRNMCQIFTVDDLMHLRKSGRISNIAAVAGTVLSIKPLLKGDETGHIVSFGKAIGRKRAIQTLAAKYEALAVHPEEQTIGIAHADCEQDAARLAALLLEKRPPKDILTVCYEPVTGAHVGPGALALFFLGDERVRSLGEPSGRA